MTGVGSANSIRKAMRVSKLFVVRESDENDDELFNGMRELTYQPHRDMPAVEAVRRAGMTPLKCRDSFEVDDRGKTHKVIVERFREGASEAILFSYGGFWHLWSQSSAAKLSVSGINEFTQLLVKVIARLRPREIYVANVSRLIRSKWQGAKLEDQLHKSKVECVVAGDMRFWFKDGDETGPMMFGMFATVASLERNWIVQRLLTGRIAKWRRNEWPYGGYHSPFGYNFDPDSRQLVVDESSRDAVAQMLAIMSMGMPPAETQRQLSAAGVKSMRRDKRTKERYDIGWLQDPSTMMAGIFGWAPLWCAGEYLLRFRNAFPHLDELSGVPIVRYEEVPVRRANSSEDADYDLDFEALIAAAADEGVEDTDAYLAATDQGEDENDPGELQMLHKYPLPPGGWADESTLTAFAEAAIQHSDLLRARRVRPRDVSPTVAVASAVPELHQYLLPRAQLVNRDEITLDRRHAARARAFISPFAGRSWIRDGHHEEIFVSNPLGLRIERWPLDPKLPGAPSAAFGVANEED